MADWETIQERVISGKGVLKVPTDVAKNRAYVLFATVIRQPRNKYLNFNWNPARSRYGNLVFLRKGYVVNTLPIEFSKQVFDGINDISGQTLIAVKCAYEGILQTFVNLGNGLAGTPGGIGLSVTPITDQIKDYENLRLAWDEVRLQCYADTAISLRLDRLVYDTCDPDKDKDKPPPPPPPPPDEPIEPGEPIVGISPPYEGDNDDGNTEPYPDDDFPPPPVLGGECQSGVLTFDYVFKNSSSSPEQTATASTNCFGPVSQEFRIKAGEPNVIETQHRGNPLIGGCSTYQYRDILSLGSTAIIVSWSNINFS